MLRVTKKEGINNLGGGACAVDMQWPREALCKGYCLSWSFKSRQETSEQDVELSSYCQAFHLFQKIAWLINQNKISYSHACKQNIYLHRSEIEQKYKKVTKT